MKDNALIICLSIIIIVCNVGFGANLEESPQTQKVSAEDILDQLRNGSDVSYDHVLIYGDLELQDPQNKSGSEEEGLRDQSADMINSSIRITRSIFNGNVKLENKIFKNIARLENNVFIGDVHFNGSKFMHETSFNGSKFKKSAFFLKSKFFNSMSLRRILFEGYCGFDAAVFEEKASLRGVSFLGDTSFSKTVFENSTTFEDSSCRGNFSFYKTSFMKEVNFLRSRLEGKQNLFSKAVFSDSANFGESTFNNTDLSWSIFNGKTQVLNGVFNGNTDFRHAAFEKDTAFFALRFNGEVNFVQSKFGQEASFKSTLFNGSATFDNVDFENRAQFSDAKFLKSAGFNESKFKGDALFEGTVFGGILFLTRAEYERMFIRWENITHLEFDDSSFLLLIENFKKLGYWSDADKSYYAYRLERNRYLPVIYRPTDWMLSILYGYGTRPEFSLFWFGITILLFGVVFYRVDGVHKGDKRVSIWDAIFFSATNIASGTKTLSGFVSTPSDFKAAGRFQYLIVLEKFLGMLLFALFLTALARTVIR